MKRSGRVWATAGALLGVLIVTACGSSSNDEPETTDATPEVEKTFTWYTSMESEAAEGILADFERDYPEIDTTLVKSDNPGILQTLLADHSRRQVKADVVSLSNLESALQAEKVGALEKYIPEEALANVDQATRLAEPTGIVMYRGGYPWVYRSDAPPEIVKAFEEGSWAMFDDPAIRDALTGQIAAADPATNGAAVDAFRNLYYALGEDGFWPLVENFGKTRPVLSSSNLPAIEAVSSGERMAGLMAEVVAVQAAEDNPVLRLKYFDPTPGFYRLMALTNGAPHPEAGKVFMRWVLSDAGQESMQNNYGVKPIANNVPDSRPVTKLPWFTADAMDSDKIVIAPADFLENLDTVAYTEKLNKALGK